MSPESMQEKTAVFTPGMLAGEDEPRLYDVDEPTRELPLIYGRFAGREWDAEEYRLECAQKRLAGRGSVRRYVATLAVGGFAAALLLVGSLFGQARLVDMNEEAVTVSEEIAALRQEQKLLRVEYEQAITPAELEAYAVETLGMQSPRGDQLYRLESTGEDKATVLNLRKGTKIQHFWQSIIDTLGVSFQ